MSIIQKSFLLAFSVILTASAADKTFTEPRWKVADFPSPVIVPGSALDFSGIKPRYPVDECGRLIPDGKGGAFFENRPGKPVRLLGANCGPDLQQLRKLPAEQWKKELDDYAEQFRVQGYDYIRTNCWLDSQPFHGTAEPQMPNPEMLDMADYWIHALRRRDIHIYGTLVSYQFGFPLWKQGMGQRTDFKCRTFYGEPEALAQWDKTVRNLLNHVNPYTGLAWKDDPVFLAFEFYNEQEICLNEVFIANRISAKGKTYILNGFKRFLKEKYHTSEALSGVWGREIRDFSHGLGVGNPPRGAAASDWEEYTMKCGEKTFRHFEKTVRSTGCRTPVTNFNFRPSMNFTRLREKTVEISAMNTYFHHPTRWMRPGSKVAQNSSIETLAGYWRSLATTRIAGRPLFVGEYNHCYWNPYVYEAGLLFPAYSALQGFTGLTAHADQVRKNFQGAPDCFSIVSLPTMRANEILSMLLFGRGDVSQSRHRVDLLLKPEKDLTDGQRCVNMQQSLLALVCGLAAAVPEPAFPSVKADLVIPAAEGTAIQSFDWSAAVDSDRSISLICKELTKLKNSGILSDENPTNPAGMIYQSDTGEITLNGQKKSLSVITSRTEGIARPADDSEQKLNVLTVCRNTAPGTVALTSLDGKPLRECSRMLFIFNTMSASTGLRLSADGSKLLDAGSLPVRLETGIIRCRLSIPRSASVRLYPLSINGIRRSPLTFSRNADTLEFEIDTAKLPQGPTPYFELITE